jgi:hypothetical protein
MNRAKPAKIIDRKLQAVVNPVSRRVVGHISTSATGILPGNRPPSAVTRLSVGTTVRIEALASAIEGNGYENAISRTHAAIMPALPPILSDSPPEATQSVATPVRQILEYESCMSGFGILARRGKKPTGTAARYAERPRATAMRTKAG